MDSIVMSTLVTLGLMFLSGGILLVKVEVK
jgi:hypothetical protein